MACGPRPLYLLGCLCAGLFCLAWARLAAEEPADLDDFGKRPNPEDVIRSLIEKLSVGPAVADDAAMKLGHLGSRSVPQLAPLLKTGDEQVRYYAALALSRVRHRSAAEALLPLLEDPKAPRRMRLLAMQSAGGEGLEEAVGVLKDLASDPADPEMRLKALQTLSVMPVAWGECEKLFVGALDDERDEIQALAVQVCLLAAAVKVFYTSAEAKLLDRAQKAPDIGTRCKALATLNRLKSGRAVGVAVHLLDDPATPGSVARTALDLLASVTGVVLKDAPAALKWWEKYGQARYANAAPLAPVAPRPAPPRKAPAAVAPAAVAPAAVAPTAAERPVAVAPAAVAPAAVAPTATERPVAVAPPPAPAVERVPPPDVKPAPPREPVRPRLLPDDPPDKPFKGLPMNGE